MARVSGIYLARHFAAWASYLVKIKERMARKSPVPE